MKEENIQSTTRRGDCPLMKQQGQLVPGLGREFSREERCRVSDGQVQAWANGKTKESGEV